MFRSNLNIWWGASSLWARIWRIQWEFTIRKKKESLAGLHWTSYPSSRSYMHMTSGISLVTSVGKVPGWFAHIVLKLPFLSQNDIPRNLDAVIDLTDVTPKTHDYLGYILRGWLRNCASFVWKLISEQESKNKTKDQEMRTSSFVVWKNKPWYGSIFGKRM